MRSRLLPVFIVVVLVGGATFVGGLLVSGLRVENPVKTETVDRSSPVVVDAVYDLADLHGSTATISVVVDLERDTRYVPSALLGERVLYQAFGTVDGVVRLSGLDADSVTVADDGSVTVTVPRAHLSDVTLDLDESRVLSRSRGLMDRAMGVWQDTPTSERDLQRAGVAKIEDAAAETDLLERAETNAERLLVDLLEAGGATGVKISWIDPPPASA